MYVYGVHLHMMSTMYYVNPQWDAASAYDPEQSDKPCDKLPSAYAVPTSSAVTGQKRKRISRRTYLVPSGFEKEIDRCNTCLLVACCLSELTCLLARRATVLLAQTYLLACVMLLAQTYLLVCVVLLCCLPKLTCLLASCCLTKLTYLLACVVLLAQTYLFACVVLLVQNYLCPSIQSYHTSEPKLRQGHRRGEHR